MENVDKIIEQVTDIANNKSCEVLKDLGCDETVFGSQYHIDLTSAIYECVVASLACQIK